MYVMDIYSVKQPQNIIIKVNMKEDEIGKKNTEKKLNDIYIIAFILSVRQLLVQLFYNRKSCSVNFVWI